MKIKRRDFTAAVLAGSVASVVSPEAARADVQQQPAPACPPDRLRLQVLGSSAGKPVPRPFCLCPACQQARELGGRNCRTRTSMNIYTPGDTLGRARYRVDLSPDAMHHLIQNHLDETALEHLLVTHDHGDHLDPAYLSMRGSAVDGAAEMKPLDVYGGAEVEQRLRSRVNLEKCKIEFHHVEPFEEVAVGELTVFSLRANHGAPGYLNYVVQAAGRTVLLAWDTGYWSDETWQAASRFHFDAVLLECTVAAPGGRDAGSRHLNHETFLAMKTRMADSGMLQPAAPFVSMHIGDNGRLGHDQLQEYWTPHGVTVGYDGLLVEVGGE